MSTQKNLYPIVTLIILIFSLSCEKETNNINSNLKLAKEFHIKTISKELASFSKALTPIFNNQQNLNLLKEAIYLKKRDENITINDLNKSLESSFNFEQELYTNLTKINKISFEDFKRLIDEYDLTIYWEFIENWDGVTIPKIGYPINEEEDVNNNYDLLHYSVNFDGIEKIIERTYLKNNPVLIIRPNEDFENNSPSYYSKEPYIWLYDLMNKNDYKNAKIEQVPFDRFRLETINTGGSTLDGSGGPELRFFRNSPTSYTNGKYGFATILSLNLTASASQTTQDIEVKNYISNILHDDWHIIDFRSLIGTYEEDGGLIHNQVVSGIGIEANLLGVPVVNISFNSKISRKDDLLDKYEMYRSSFVYNVQQKNNWGWGFNYMGLPYRKSTNNTSLKVTYKNNY